MTTWSVLTSEILFDGFFALLLTNLASAFDGGEIHQSLLLNEKLYFSGDLNRKLVRYLIKGICLLLEWFAI